MEDFKMKPKKMYVRVGDMSPNRSLVLYMEGDGDIQIAIARTVRTDDNTRDANHILNLREDQLLYDDSDFALVEFCTDAGRGRSFKVRRALVALAEAIEEDNRKSPIPLQTVSEWEKKRKEAHR
jgi:hypothetical protein